MSQTERIFYIFDRIGKCGSFKASEVYRRFEVDDRTVKRDIECIRNRLAVPLAWDSHRRAYVVEGGVGVPLMASMGEKLLVMAALFKGLARTQGVSPEVTELLADSLNNAMPPEYRAIIDKVVFTAPVVDFPPYGTMDLLAKALGQKCVLVFDCKEVNGDVSRKRVEPKRLINNGGRWYAVVYEADRDALSIFDLNRISNLRVEPVMQVHDVEDRIDEYIDSGYGLSMEPAKGDATIRIMGEAMAAVATRVWHRNQVVRHAVLPSGERCIEITVPVSSYEELLSKALSYGSLACPVAPPEFVSLYRAELERMSARSKG